jgi:hypothetical protein
MRQLNGEVTITDPFVLINPLIKGGYNLVKIGSVITKDYRDKAHEDYNTVYEVGYWVSYHPKTNEIIITESHSNWEDFNELSRATGIMGRVFTGNDKLNIAQQNNLVLLSPMLEEEFTVPVPPGYDLPKEKKFKDLFTPGEYSKFNKIEEGQSDERDYVKIVSTDENNQNWNIG